MKNILTFHNIFHHGKTINIFRTILNFFLAYNGKKKKLENKKLVGEIQ